MAGIRNMICFIPQVLVKSDDDPDHDEWINVGIESATIAEAENQASQFPLTDRILQFRVIESEICS